MLYWLIPLCFGIISLVVFLYFRVKEQRVKAVILKGITSLFFIATGILSFLSSQSPRVTFGVFTIIGLFFGLLGDIFLDIKFITKNYEYLFTALGFITFGIGHICFTTGLFLNFYDFSKSVLYIIIPGIATLICVVLTLLMEKISKIKYGNMKPYVVGYGLVIFFAVFMYFSVALQHGFQLINLDMMFGGLVLFAFSDLILNNTFFAPNCNTPAYVISNHVVYYIAQFVIASSLFFLI